MERRYTILERKAPPAGGPQVFSHFTASTAAGGHPPGLASATTLTVDTLPEREAAQLKANPRQFQIALAMPTRLVSPLDGTINALKPAWGVGAVQADRSACTGAGVTVAVLDTGIDATHPAFAGVRLQTRNFTVPEADARAGDVTDGNGHGTHCAGTIFGRDGQAGVGRIGVARGVANALIGKVLSDRGSGDSDMIFNAMDWAVAHGANVISMSLGFDFPGMVERLTGEGMPVALATSYALEAYRDNLRMFDATMDKIDARSALSGAPVVIAAAGNESRKNENPDFRIGVSIPAAAEDVISVAPAGVAGNRFFIAPFSNIRAIVTGPGVDITSAWPGGGYNTISGTSMACPHVAGVAALWWESLRNQGSTPNPQMVSARLMASTRLGIFAANDDEADYGQGMVTAPLQ